jgi:hypothetical protein
MNRRQSVSALAAAGLLAGSFASSSARADLPKAQEANIKAMDKNKNGRIEKEEFIAYMSAMFDRSAGAKGYCTYEEVAKGLSQLNDPHSGS